ncbi:MAG: sigma-54-dependent Fis family transcriptional regulator [Spirochaetes bacterium RBG_13_68_11]|nr:MAG: sigma-54-dependent Fis family transcriptional regulator [Spirochaetes bacterium RBG_13_68_11]
MPGSPERLLVVDDTSTALEILTRTLGAYGYETVGASSVAQAVRALETGPFDLVLTDYRMPGASGLDLVRHVRENLPGIGIVMVTGYGSIQGAVSAVKLGADEYLAKPFTDEELVACVRRALESAAARRAAGLPTAGTPGTSRSIIGSSTALRRVHGLIARAARSTATVLVSGESGTGKELVARAIHYAGSRAAAPFVAVNCAAIPEPLAESELFGYVRGAFTGAAETRAGFFQAADGGTLFLDEVSGMPPSLQAKLLRALQDREVMMVGARRAARVDVRVIAATNQDLAALVRRGAFREDLFYRLNVLAIDLPALRDRGDDILELAGHFLRHYARESGRDPPRFTRRALAALQRHAWPGNVRELANLVQRLVVMTEGPEIDAADLPSLLRFAAPASRSTPRTLAELEAEHILAALSAAGGNRTRAAEVLGIDRKTLGQKLRRIQGGAVTRTKGGHGGA